MKYEHLMALLLVMLVAIAFAGCAHDPVAVSGNGSCRPSQDLPAKQTMQRVPEKETEPDDLWALFLNERSLRSGEQGQYNSLYKQCVQPARGGVSGS